MSNDSKIKEYMVSYFINGKVVHFMRVFATSPADAKTSFKRHLHQHHKRSISRQGLKSFKAELVKDEGF